MASEKAIKRGFPSVIITGDRMPFSTDQVGSCEPLRIEEGKDVNKDLGGHVHEGWWAIAAGPWRRDAAAGVAGVADGCCKAMVVCWIGGVRVKRVEDGQGFLFAGFVVVCVHITGDASIPGKQ